MHLNRSYLLLTCLIALATWFSSGCTERDETVAAPTEAPSRTSAIPATVVKATGDSDPTPPILHSREWQEPVAIQGPVNTAGGEDSPFITPDGQTLYFFFTADV